MGLYQVLSDPFAVGATVFVLGGILYPFQVFLYNSRYGRALDRCSYCNGLALLVFGGLLVLAAYHQWMSTAYRQMAVVLTLSITGNVAALLVAAAAEQWLAATERPSSQPVPAIHRGSTTVH